MKASVKSLLLAGVPLAVVAASPTLAQEAPVSQSPGGSSPLAGQASVADDAMAPAKSQAPDSQPLGDETLTGAQPVAQPSAELGAEQGIADIVVTARRRAEPLQQTPLAVSAIGPARLAEVQATNISDLTTLVPSINLARNSQNPASIFAYIRGFGNKSSDPSSEPAVAITVDGIYQATVVGSSINLFDIEAVEVLRGPQGTLLGKNAPAGGISVRTRRPGADFGGFAQVSYGSYGDFQIAGYVDAPIVADKLFVTLSYSRQRSDGYIKNVLTNDDIGGIYAQTVRAAFLAKPSDSVTWYVTAQYDIDKGEDQAARNVSDFTPLAIPGANYGNSPPPVTGTCTNALFSGLCGTTFPNRTPYTTNAIPLPRRDNSGFSLASNLDIEAGPVSFAAVTGYRRFDEDTYANLAGAPLNIFSTHYLGTFRQFSQEVRVASSKGGGLDLNGKLNWLLGIYYLSLDFDRPIDSVTNNRNSRNYQDGTSTSIAVFGTADYKLTDKLSLAAGFRQTWDRKSHTSVAAGTSIACADPAVPCFGISSPAGYRSNRRASWDNLSVDATLSYQFTRNKMVYLRYAQGYRGGAFTGVPASAIVDTIVDPETVDSYELGSKADFFDNRLRVNISAFISKYKSLQRTTNQSVTTPPFFAQIARNIASATTQGVELEVQARPVRQLVLRGNVGYLDAKYDDFFANLTSDINNGPTQNTGLRLAYSSKWTALIGGTYEWDLRDKGALAFSVDYAYRSSLFLDDLNGAYSFQKSYGLLSASISWTDSSDRLKVSVYGKNLTDRHYIDGAGALANISTFVADAPPRTIGASAAIKF